jgi:hypothetical protein
VGAPSAGETLLQPERLGIVLDTRAYNGRWRSRIPDSGADRQDQARVYGNISHIFDTSGNIDRGPNWEFASVDEAKALQSAILPKFPGFRKTTFGLNRHDQPHTQILPADPSCPCG